MLCVAARKVYDYGQTSSLDGVSLCCQSVCVEVFQCAVFSISEMQYPKEYLQLKTRTFKSFPCSLLLFKGGCGSLGRRNYHEDLSLWHWEKILLWGKLKFQVSRLGLKWIFEQQLLLLQQLQQLLLIIIIILFYLQPTLSTSGLKVGNKI